MEPYVITIKTIHATYEIILRAENLEAAKAETEKLFTAIATGNAIYSLRPQFILLGDANDD
jgi:hypothetical protein